MKTKIVAISLLLSLGLSTASGEQPDPRFYGVWVGEETYEISARPPSGVQAGQWGAPPVKSSAVLAISGSGKTLFFGQGRLQGMVEISARWRKNMLDFEARSPFSRRSHGKLVLSSDGNTLTETAVAFLPGRPFDVTCNISGTFHREEKK